MKRTPLRAKSAKRVSDDRKRKQLREQYLEDNWICKAKLPGCQVAATDVHELVNRSQLPGAQLIPELFLGLCRRCHSYITDHPRWSYAHGFSIHSWDYYDFGSKAVEAAQHARDTCRDTACEEDHWKIEL